MAKQREFEFDILRIVAAIAVIATHVCGSQIHDLPVTTSDFVWLNVIRAAITWDVPIFVMISGRFFLDPEREMPFRKILKSIWHLAVAFVIWDVVYQIYYVLSGAYGDLNWKGILSQALVGPYHMWYLFLIVGLYVATPLLRKITEEKRLMEYFIVLFLISQFVQQYAVKMPLIGDVVTEMWGKVYFHIGLGYAGYFVLGYYLYRYGIPRKLEKWLYAVTVLMIVFSCVGTTLDSFYSGEANAFFSTYQTPNVIVESCGVYVFFTNRVSKIKWSEQIKGKFAVLGKWGLGIYLSHALMLEFLALTGLTPTFMTPIVGVALMTTCVFAMSVVLVWLIQKVPVLKKYMM